MPIYRFTVHWCPVALRTQQTPDVTVWEWLDIPPAWTHVDDMLLVRHPDGAGIGIKRAAINYSEFEVLPDP